MKSKYFSNVACIAVLILIGIISCKKDQLEEKPFQTGRSVEGAPADIKEWFEKNYSDNVTNNGFSIYDPALAAGNKTLPTISSEKSSYHTFSTNWKKARTFLKGDSTVVEVELFNNDDLKFAITNTI